MVLGNTKRINIMKDNSSKNTAAKNLQILLTWGNEGDEFVVSIAVIAIRAKKPLIKKLSRQIPQLRQVIWTRPRPIFLRSDLRTKGKDIGAKLELYGQAMALAQRIANDAGLPPEGIVSATAEDLAKIAPHEHLPDIFGMHEALKRKVI